MGVREEHLPGPEIAKFRAGRSLFPDPVDDMYASYLVNGIKGLD